MLGVLQVHVVGGTDWPAWIAAIGAVGAFAAAGGALVYQRREIRLLRRQTQSAALVVELRTRGDDYHDRWLVVRNLGPAVAREITVAQDPWHSATFQTGITPGWVPTKPLALMAGQGFAMFASASGLGSDTVADIVLTWQDGNGKHTERVPLDFSLPTIGFP